MKTLSGWILAESSNVSHFQVYREWKTQIIILGNIGSLPFIHHLIFSRLIFPQSFALRMEQQPICKLPLKYSGPLNQPSLPFATICHICHICHWELFIICDFLFVCSLDHGWMLHISIKMSDLQTKSCFKLFLLQALTCL